LVEPGGCERQIERFGHVPAFIVAQSFRPITKREKSSGTVER
jgi:hypothetical protein